MWSWVTPSKLIISTSIKTDTQLCVSGHLNDLWGALLPEDNEMQPEEPVAEPEFTPEPESEPEVEPESEPEVEPESEPSELQQVQTLNEEGLSISTGALVGIIIGCVLGALLINNLIIYMVAKRCKTKKNTTSMPLRPTGQNNDATQHTSPANPELYSEDSDAEEEDDDDDDNE